MHEIKGVVISIVDNQQQKTVLIETAPAVAASEGNKAVPANRVALSTNAHSSLPDVKRGQTVKISFEIAE